MSFRIRKLGPDFIVEFRDPSKQDSHWAQIRMARLLKEDNSHPLQVGLYCCSPIASGYKVVFKYLNIEIEEKKQ